jgi:peptide/nickel transport system substrate-binding protein
MIVRLQRPERSRWARAMGLGIVMLLAATTALFASGTSEAPAGMSEPEPEIVLASGRDIVPGPTDFYFASSIVRVWEPLVAVDESWAPVPGLAESWEMSEDGTQWTFALREGVVFHDGTPFTADAVLANFDRYAAVGTGRSRFYSFSLDRFYPGFVGIEKLDDYTVQLEFDRPSPTVLFSMTSFGSAMFSPASFDESGAFTGTPAGTGPFRVVERADDQYAVLERFDDYWGIPAHAERVRIRVIPDANTRVSAFRAEEIMGVLDIGVLPPVLAGQLLTDDRFASTAAPNSIIHYLSLNGTKFPFDDVRMRRAVSLALDRELLAEAFYGGVPAPAAHILNHASPFFIELPVEHDPELARKLSGEVLGEERFQTTFVVPAGFVERYPYREQAEYVQSVLADLGIDAEIRLLEWGAYREAQRTGEYGLGMQIQGLPNGEPSSIFSSFMRSDSGQNRDYSLGFSSPEADRLIAEAEQTLDMEARGEIYRELQRISAREFPVVPLINDVNLFVYNRRIEAYEARVYGVTIDTMRWAER